MKEKIIDKNKKAKIKTPTKSDKISGQIQRGFDIATKWKKEWKDGQNNIDQQK